MSRARASWPGPFARATPRGRRRAVHRAARGRGGLSRPEAVAVRRRGAAVAPGAPHPRPRWGATGGAERDGPASVSPSAARRRADGPSRRLTSRGREEASGAIVFQGGMRGRRSASPPSPRAVPEPAHAVRCGRGPPDSHPPASRPPRHAPPPSDGPGGESRARLGPPLDRDGAEGAGSVFRGPGEGGGGERAARERPGAFHPGQRAPVALCARGLLLGERSEARRSRRPEGVHDPRHGSRDRPVGAGVGGGSDGPSAPVITPALRMCPRLGHPETCGVCRPRRWKRGIATRGSVGAVTVGAPPAFPATARAGRACPIRSW